MARNLMFRTSCILTDKYSMSLICNASIAVNGDSVEFSCVNGSGETYRISAGIATFKKLIHSYTAVGITLMENDKEHHTNVRYTKGGLGVNDKHATFSVSDENDSEFMITAEATNFDRWLRLKMRKEHQP